MLVKAAFEYMVMFQGRNRLGEIYSTLPKPANLVKINMAPSSFQTQPEEVESMVGRGRQFLITHAQVFAVLGRSPVRGDRIEESFLGKATINQVKELVDVGGGVIGYRIWVE